MHTSISQSLAHHRQTDVTQTDERWAEKKTDRTWHQQEEGGDGESQPGGPRWDGPASGTTSRCAARLLLTETHTDQTHQVCSVAVNTFPPHGLQYCDRPHGGTRQPAVDSGTVQGADE